eukprot:1990818-Prymnesium_polylepis.1
MQRMGRLWGARTRWSSKTRSDGGCMGDAALTESRGFVTVSPPRKVHHPPTALLPLQRVAEAKLADATNTIRRDE